MSENQMTESALRCLDRALEALVAEMEQAEAERRAELEKARRVIRQMQADR